MRISVVIPTYNRSETFKKCLDALFEQHYDHAKFEIIVVDDGSDDDTQKILQRFKKKSPVSFSFFSQPNQGQGVARNHGIAVAQGEIILLIGDDIIATPSLLHEHDRMHVVHPEENAAVLGFVTWHPELPITPLMEFMERGGALFGKFGGHQFAYDLLRGQSEANYNFFYTANISLKRSLVTRFKFDPWFSGYGWEDIELGYRLTKQAKLKLYYNAQAVAYHDHMMDEKQFAERMRSVGRSSHCVNKKYPELRRLPDARKRIFLTILSSRALLKIFKVLSQNFYFYALSKKYFLQGLREGYNKKNVKF